MIEWGILRNYILTGVLGTTSQVTPDQLTLWARWACQEISYHTAEYASLVSQCDGTTNLFPAPNNAVDGVDRAALITLTDSTMIRSLEFKPREIGGEWQVVQKLNSSQSRSRNLTYCEWPTGTVYLNCYPLSGETLTIQYFKFWEAPSTDRSTLNFPQWMELPFAYLVSAYAMNPDGVTASDIRQWGTRQDSGNPESNPLHKQSKFFLDQAQRLLNRVAPQDRETFFKTRT